MATAPVGMSFSTALLRLIEDSLTFTWDAGAVTTVSHPHTTGWRRVPALITAHVLGAHFRHETDRAGVDLPPGTCICMGENVLHNITIIPPDLGLSRWSHVRFRALGAIDPLLALDLPHSMHGPAAVTIGDVNEALAALAAPTNLTSIAARRALGFRLLEQVAACSKPREAGIELLRSAERLAPVLAAVEADLGHESLDLTRLARIAGLSPSRFHVVFRSALGMAPSRWLQERRLVRARELLASSDLPVHLVAERSGFNDPFHFSRLFKRTQGIPPAEYRARSRSF